MAHPPNLGEGTMAIRGAVIAGDFSVIRLPGYGEGGWRVACPVRLEDNGTLHVCVFEPDREYRSTESDAIYLLVSSVPGKDYVLAVRDESRIQFLTPHPLRFRLAVGLASPSRPPSTGGRFSFHPNP